MTLIDGEFGLYQGDDGKPYSSVRRGQSGLPLLRFLPASAQGENFEKFPVADFFGYSYVWLASAAQWEAWHKISRPKPTPGNNLPVKVPRIDLAGYDLENLDRSINNEKLAEITDAIGLLWEHNPAIAPQTGMFFALHQSGMSPDNIAQTIIQMADNGGLKEAGQLDFSALGDNLGHQIMDAVSRTYARLNGFSAGEVLPQSDIQKMMATWFRWTRSVGEDDPNFANHTMLWLEYRQLRLVANNGDPILNQVVALAEYVFSQTAEVKPNFSALAQWARVNFENKVVAQSLVAKTSQKALRKKRKQGKVNRKRGRR